MRFGSGCFSNTRSSVSLPKRYRFSLPGRLLALTLALTSGPAFAESVELQTLRAQLQQAESLGMTDMANAIRPVIEALEQDEANSASTNGSAQSITVRKSYFAEIGRANLERCDYAKDVQFDSICTAAMLRYNDYLVAASAGATQEALDEAWRRHEATALTYTHGIGVSGNAVRPTDHTLKTTPPAPQSPAHTQHTPSPADTTNDRTSAPCPDGRPCATPQ